MRQIFVHVLSAAAIGAFLAISGSPAFAKTVKECNAEYAAQKDALKAAGTTKKDFIASCRGEADAAAPAAPATAAPAAAPATAAATLAGGKTAKECAAEYAANKDAIKARGETKKDFIAACRTGPTAPEAATAPTPAPAPSPAPAAAKPAPVPTATEAQLKAKCPSDTIVWVNTKSKIYHFAGTHDYGNTKSGAYMCEMDATAAGDRAAKNEKHP